MSIIITSSIFAIKRKVRCANEAYAECLSPCLGRWARRWI